MVVVEARVDFSSLSDVGYRTTTADENNVKMNVDLANFLALFLFSRPLLRFHLSMHLRSGCRSTSVPVGVANNVKLKTERLFFLTTSESEPRHSRWRNCCNTKTGNSTTMRTETLVVYLKVVSCWVGVVSKVKAFSWERSRVYHGRSTSDPTELWAPIQTTLSPFTATTTVAQAASTNSQIVRHFSNNASCRRSWVLQQTASMLVASSLLTIAPNVASADFTPGGTLVLERSIGVTVGNPDASTSRKPDNSNVLFDKDFYFKFGTAAPYIEPESTTFPLSMPFTKSQQRYDALKKYRERVLSGFETMKSLEKKPAVHIADPAGVDVYQLRPMGLLANGFLASENTGTSNELFLARWYINEIYLLIGDMRTTDDLATRKKLDQSMKKAINSYSALLNRVITGKVGDKLVYIE